MHFNARQNKIILTKSVKSFLISLLCFGVLLFPQLVLSQANYKLDKTTRFDKIGVKDGLSSEYTRCIHQDKYGFIWIGTHHGLNRFDGYNIEVFSADPKNPESMISDEVTGILEEEDGTMWFSTRFGMSKYNRSDQTFTNYRPDTTNIFNRVNNIRNIIEDGDYLWVNVYHDLFRFNKQTGEFTSFGKDTLDPLKGIKYAYTRYIFIDGSGVLWVCSKSAEAKRSLSRFDKETETFIHYQNEPSNPESFVNKTVYSMIEDKEGIIWIATNGGGLLELTDKENGKFKRYVHDDLDTNSIINNYLKTVFEDTKGNIWTGGNGGFSLLNKKTDRFTNYRIPNRTNKPNRVNVITNITENESAKFWLDAWEGFYKFDPFAKRLIHFLKNPDNPSGLRDNNVGQIFIDSNSQVWIVTLTESVFRINDYANSFKWVRKIPYVKNSLSGNHINNFYADSKGYFWIGTHYGNLTRIKIKNGKVLDKFKHFSPDNSNQWTIGGSSINAIFEDSNNTLWFGTFSGLNKYNEEDETFTRYQFDSNDSTSISSNAIEDIYEDSHGTFWVTTRNGLNIMDRDAGKFHRLMPDNKDSTSIMNTTVWRVYEDSKGELWLSGLYLERLIRSDTSFFHYVTKDHINKIRLNSIWDIKEDDSANLWLASVKGGLIRMNRSNNTFKTFTVEDGLPSNSIHSLEIDNNGDIWVTSNRGLSRLNYNTHEIKNYDIGDGLVDLELIEQSLYKDKEGWLYFGTREGFNYFHPDSLKENTCIPPVYITSMSVAGDQRYFDQPLYEMEDIELNYNESDLSFDFVALNYINPQRNQFAYMLEGYDDDWIYVGNKRTANYTNLDPGKYTFKVKGSNNDGYWNEKGASLTLVIQPPFWRTWWAYILYIISFLGLLYLIRRNEMKKIQLRQELELKNVTAENLAQLDVEKNKFFSNISHEFRTPLTLILGPLERIITGKKAGQEKEQLQLVRRNANRLQTLINQLLSLTKLESGKMKLKARPENIVKLSRLFIQSFHSMAEAKDIKLEFESDAEEHIVYLDTLKYEKVVNNLLSNALKFTERGGKIKVSITAFSPPFPKGAGGIQIKFSDTGIGIRKEKLPHVFDRFYQVDEQQLKTNLGTGIGMALTKELVELHHGTITVESEPGMGTSFTLVFHKGKEHLSENEIIASSSTSIETDDELVSDDYLFIQDAVSGTELAKEVDKEGNLPLLLLVEDNEDMRSYIKSYLVGSYQIIEAANGKDGAELAIEHLPDLIISDLMMPQMDGNEMTSLLKQDERTSHIPIILLTAKASQKTKLEGLETGADDFLTKPFDANELLLRIKNLVEQRARLRKLLSQHLGDSAHTKIIKETAGNAMSKLDEKFLEKAKDIIEEQMADPYFSVEMFAEQMAMSRTQLHRKLKSLTDHSASGVIRDIRLNKAAELLKEGELNVTQISYEIGISSLSYFSKAFKEKFGVTPSEYS